LNPAIVIAVLFILVTLGYAQSPRPETKQQREERMKWWREARFGMFIHWGLYAVPAGEWKGKKIGGIGEWIMESADIPLLEYEQFAKKFNPVKFDADQWTRIAKNAGMKYIVITSKHHDGFCLWDSKVSDYDIMDASRFKRDILKELSVACKKHGIRLCFYHSIMDWHHPDAQGPFYPNYNDGSRTNPNFSRYVQNYMKPQLKELISNYGPLGVLWFDGEWIKDWDQEQGRDLAAFCRKLQPDLVINNRVGKRKREDGDFGTPEQTIPPKGLGYDWETCMTMNNTWGFKSYDDNWKSTEDLLRKLADIASKGGNFLLNVGPTAEGLIPQPSVERLKAMGKWMKANGESIYGTTASPLGKVPWGRCTAKPGKLYLHVFNWPTDGKLEVSMPPNKVKRAYLLAYEQRGDLLLGGSDNLVITIPRKAPDPVNTVVVLEIEGKAAVTRYPLEQAKDGAITFQAEDARVHGTSARYESGGGKDNIGYWSNPSDYVTWPFEVTKPGTFNVEVTFACTQGAAGSEYTISVAEQELAGKVTDTGSWTNFATEKLGTLKITKAGTYTLSLKPKTMPGSAVMNLKSVMLVPIKK